MKKGKSHFRLPSDGQPVIQALQAGPLLSSVPVRTGKYRHAPAVLAAGRHHYCYQNTCPACPSSRTGTLPACLIRPALYCLQSRRFGHLQSQHLTCLQGSACSACCPGSLSACKTRQVAAAATGHLMPAGPVSIRRTVPVSAPVRALLPGAQCSYELRAWSWLSRALRS